MASRAGTPRWWTAPPILKSTSQTMGAVMLARAAERLADCVRVGSALAEAEGLLTAAQLAWQAVGVQLGDIVSKQRVPSEAGAGTFIKQAMKSVSGGGS
jgi:hypothetical protein